MVEQTGETKAGPTRYQGKDSEDESSEDDADEDMQELRPKEDVVMRVTSTQTQGGRVRDTALGSRQQRSGRAEKAQGGQVVGERSVTFVPESKKKRRDAEVEEAPAPQRKSSGSRRSASSNTFRKM
jgi:ribosome biogenesis protein ENP2